MSKADREAPILMVKRNGALYPAERWSEEEIDNLPNGARFNCYITIAKSSTDDEHGRLLTRYVTGIGELFDWLPNTGAGTDFPTPTHLRRHILKELGFCETWPQRDGTLRKEAHSMSRDAMSFEDLKICFELTRAWVGVYTEAVASERFEPWEIWENDHPPEAKK